MKIVSETSTCRSSSVEVLFLSVLQENSEVLIIVINTLKEVKSMETTNSEDK
jgi:hypothetical protein